MGLITSTYRMMYLTAYQLTLESKIQWISTAKMELMASSNDIMSLGNDLDPDNPAVKQMQARRDRLTVLEKKLDMQMQEYQTRNQTNKQCLYWIVSFKERTSKIQEIH